MARFVYQVFNITQREAYIGMARAEGHIAFKGFRDKPPFILNHWDFKSDEIQTSSIEKIEDEQDAVRFYAGLVASLRLSPFKALSFEFEPMG